MDSNITISVFAVVGIFLFGVVVGWLIAKVPVLASIRVGSPASNVPPGVVPGGVRVMKSLNTRIVRRLTLRCPCGAVWNFADGTGSLAQNEQPIPRGDSFVCPKCGKAIDLKQERQLEAQAEAEALRNLKPQN